jgi:hypothetical protein
MAKQNAKLAEDFHFDLQGKREDKYVISAEEPFSSFKPLPHHIFQRKSAVYDLAAG